MSLQFKNVTFRYDRKTEVLTGLDLEINSPTTVLLGPNGAGKSTLMTIASSQVAPLEGDVTWRRLNSTSRSDRAAYRSAVAWLPQQVAPVPGLTVREQVAYAGWLKGMSRTAAWDSSERALTRVQLSDLGARKSHQLSGGQLRRMGIAGALTYQSELILMDEPTAGLDPSQRAVFRSILDNLASDVMIVVSTHQTEDLADSYRDVVVLDKGKVRFQGTTKNFHSLVPGSALSRERAEAAYAHLVSREV